MAEYIDKDALVAEINAFKKDAYRNWKWDTFHTLNELLSFINSLEVKEVDLEKEIKDYFGNQPVVTRSKGIDYQLIPSGENIAKHFFELGIRVSNKLQKGKQ